LTVTRIAITGAAGYLGGIIGQAALADPGLQLRSVTRSPAAWVPGEAVVVPTLETGAIAGALDSPRETGPSFVPRAGIRGEEGTG